MAEAAAKHSAPKSSVDDLDDLFQILITRDIPPLAAKKQIAEALQLGKLRVDQYIAAGACKTRPMRQATPEELQAEQAGKSLDFLYAASPPGGITEPVHPQSWDDIFSLAIRDDHLVIEPHYSLDFPWQAYSFSISNRVVIDHLWPPTTGTPAQAGPAVDTEQPPPEADNKIALLEWAYGRLLDTNQLTGLRGKELLDACRKKVGSKFTASLSSLKIAKQRVREKRKTRPTQ